MPHPETRKTAGAATPTVFDEIQSGERKSEMTIPRQNDEFNCLPEADRQEVLDLLTLARDALDLPEADRQHLRDAVSYQRAALKITHKHMQGV